MKDLEANGRDEDSVSAREDEGGVGKRYPAGRPIRDEIAEILQI